MALRIVNRRRRAGQRAGMDRSKILAAALELWLTNGSEGCSIRGIALELEISPTTVHSYFKGGAEELKSEIARTALAKRALPYKPGQEPEDYLRQLIRSLLTACRKQPHLGGLIVKALSEGPLSCPIFSERVSMTLEKIVKSLPLAVALEILLTRLVGLIAMETSAWASLGSQAAKAKIDTMISGLPEPEFSTLKLAQAKLSLVSDMRGKAGYENNVASTATAAMIAELRNASR